MIVALFALFAVGCGGGRDGLNPGGGVTARLTFVDSNTNMPVPGILVQHDATGEASETDNLGFAVLRNISEPFSFTAVTEEGKADSFDLEAIAEDEIVEATLEVVQNKQNFEIKVKDSITESQTHTSEHIISKNEKDTKDPIHQDDQSTDDKKESPNLSDGGSQSSDPSENNEDKEDKNTGSDDEQSDDKKSDDEKEDEFETEEFTFDFRVAIDDEETTTESEENIGEDSGNSYASVHESFRGEIEIGIDSNFVAAIVESGEAKISISYTMKDLENSNITIIFRPDRSKENRSSRMEFSLKRLFSVVKEVGHLPLSLKRGGEIAVLQKKNDPQETQDEDHGSSEPKKKVKHQTKTKSNTDDKSLNSNASNSNETLLLEETFSEESPEETKKPATENQNKKKELESLEIDR